MRAPAATANLPPPTARARSCECLYSVHYLPCRMVSKAGPGNGRAGGDRQFFYLNGRPVDLPKAVRILNDAYKSLSSPAANASRPLAIVNFTMPPDTCADSNEHKIFDSCM